MRPSKRDEIVNKTLQVLYQNGFHATGMDTIVKKIGISKTAIYNHFRTKDDLVLAVLRLRDEHFRNWLFRRMSKFSDQPKDQLLAMFDALEEWFEEPDFMGCMFIKAASEYQELEHPIFKQSANHKELIEMHLCKLAGEANLNEPEQLVRKLLVLKEGAIVSAHLRSIENPASYARDVAALLISASTLH